MLRRTDVTASRSDVEGVKDEEEEDSSAFMRDSSRATEEGGEDLL